MSTDTADKPMPDDREKTKRTRRAEPITKRVAKNGAISGSSDSSVGRLLM